MSIQTVDPAVGHPAGRGSLAFLSPQQSDRGIDAESTRAENMSRQNLRWLSDQRELGLYSQQIMPTFHKRFSRHQVREVAAALYTNIAKAWKLDAMEAAHLLGVSREDWDDIQRKDGYWDKSLDHECVDRISHIFGIYLALHVMFDDAFANIWVTLPNAAPLFNGARPLNVMIKGGDRSIAKVRHYLDAASVR